MSAALARRKKQKAKAALAASTAEPGTNTMEQRVKHLLSQTDTPSHYEALQLLTSNTHRFLKTGDVEKGEALSRSERDEPGVRYLLP